MNFPHQTLDTSGLEKIGWHSLDRMLETRMNCRKSGRMARKILGRISAKGGDARLQDTRCKIKKSPSQMQFIGLQWVVWATHTRFWGCGWNSSVWWTVAFASSHTKTARMAVFPDGLEARPPF